MPHSFSLFDNLLVNNAHLGGETKIEFYSPRVCKSYLLDCCPNEILSQTRMSLGSCAFIHDPALKADYRNHADPDKYHYELDALVHLETFVKECDRRTEAAKIKLKETQEELPDEAALKADQINSLSEQIGTKLAKAEQLGANGHVEESLKLMNEVEELNQNKAKCESDLCTALPTSTYQQRKLRICDICSAYLGVHDNDRRLADHFGGKLHLGFVEIREKLETLRKYVAENNVVKKRKTEVAKNMETARELERQKEKERQLMREKALEEVIEKEKQLALQKEKEKEKENSKSHSRSRSRSRSHSRHKKRHHRHNGKHSHGHRRRRSGDRSGSH